MLRASTFLAACIPAVAVFAAQQHPRLFATAERLAAIKAQIAVPGSFHQQAYMAMKARVDAPDWKSRYEETRKYQHGSNTALFIPGFMAREAALLALLAAQSPGADSLRNPGSRRTERHRLPRQLRSQSRHPGHEPGAGQVVPARSGRVQCSTRN